MDLLHLDRIIEFVLQNSSSHLHKQAYKSLLIQRNQFIKINGYLFAASQWLHTRMDQI